MTTTTKDRSGSAAGPAWSRRQSALVVKSLPLDTLRWVVLVVVLYTAITMLLAARRHGQSA